MYGSQEPERGRDAVAHAGSTAAIDMEGLYPSSGTQRSVFFPWDNAARASSTSGGFAPLGSGSDRLSIDNADTHIIALRRNSIDNSGSRRSSSIVPGHIANMSGLNVMFSPDQVGQARGSGIGEDDFRFEREYMRCGLLVYGC